MTSSIEGLDILAHHRTTTASFGSHAHVSTSPVFSSLSFDGALRGGARKRGIITSSFGSLQPGYHEGKDGD